MPNRDLDLALAQRRVSEALAPDEVVAAARVTLLPWSMLSQVRLLVALSGFAAIGAGAWFSYRSGDPWWPSVAVLTLLHVRAMVAPRRRRKQDNRLLAITGEHLLLADYPTAVAPVRVVFAGPPQALQLEVRQRWRVTTIRCTAANSKLVLFGRCRRSFELAVCADTPALGVLEAFQARGGAVTPGAWAMTQVSA